MLCLYNPAVVQFGTTFRVIPVWERQGRVTNRVWLQSALQNDQQILVFDIEGSDGVENADRPQSRQFSLLALAAADSLILNIDCKDVERNEAGNLTLLRTLFQVEPSVIMHVLSFASNLSYIKTIPIYCVGKDEA